MTNFSYLYDFVRTQVKLLGELGGVNGRARQLMINALSKSLAILRGSVTVFFRRARPMIWRLMRILILMACRMRPCRSRWC